MKADHYQVNQELLLALKEWIPIAEKYLRNIYAFASPEQIVSDEFSAAYRKINAQVARMRAAIDLAETTEPAQRWEIKWREIFATLPVKHECEEKIFQGIMAVADKHGMKVAYEAAQEVLQRIERELNSEWEKQLAEIREAMAENLARNMKKGER